MPPIKIFKAWLIKSFPTLRKSPFLGDKIILSSLTFSILLNLAALIWLYFKITPRVEPIALRYTIYFGVDLIGPWWYVFYFPLSGLAVIIFNFLLAARIFIQTKILSYFLALSSLLIQLIICIISLLLILLNT